MWQQLKRYPPESQASVQVFRLLFYPSLKQCEYLRNILTPQENLRLNAFKIESAAIHYLQTRAALRVLLGSQLAIKPQRVSFQTGVFGKPALADSAGSILTFNVSHTDAWALIALADGVEIGIDIERHNSSRDLEAVARRCFSSAEYETVMKLTGKSRRVAFFDTWTAKEACIKALGEGIGSPLLKRFSVALGASDVLRQVTFEDDEVESGRWCLTGLSIPEGWSAALAVRDAPAGARHFAHYPPVLYELDGGFWAEALPGELPL